MILPKTLSELYESGYKTQTVKSELKSNLIAKIKKDEKLFPDIIGYDNTVIPEIENAILSEHDIIFLGERGQAKTRIMRGLVNLLDEKIPVLSGCEINDNPFKPICRRCRNIIDEHRGMTPVEWISPAARYAEKLATPDVTIADLIGDIDPIKVAEGRHLSDELALHYGLIPRTNRGIFSINEIPDLHEKIQVGLFNLLEERDVQIRGYKVSLPLDILIVATANPEDYTSRGRIITPLKDRFGAQIRTHYPATINEEIAIVKNEMQAFQHDEFYLTIPGFMREIIAEISHTARRKNDINHSSGISVRMSIHNMETIVSNAFRRAIRLKEKDVVPRITDLIHLSSSMKGKIEWNFMDDFEEEKKIESLIREAILNVFMRTFPQGNFDSFLKRFSASEGCEVSELLPAIKYLENIDRFPELKETLASLINNRSPSALASAVEFILEGLSVIGKIKKEVREFNIHYFNKL
jgi:magnesium chelatase subunit I